MFLIGRSTSTGCGGWPTSGESIRIIPYSLHVTEGERRETCLFASILSRASRNLPIHFEVKFHEVKPIKHRKFYRYLSYNNVATF